MTIKEALRTLNAEKFDRKGTQIKIIAPNGDIFDLAGIELDPEFNVARFICTGDEDDFTTPVEQ